MNATIAFWTGCTFQVGAIVFGAMLPNSGDFTALSLLGAMLCAFMGPLCIFSALTEKKT